MARRPSCWLPGLGLLAGALASLGEGSTWALGPLSTVASRAPNIELWCWDRCGVGWDRWRPCGAQSRCPGLSFLTVGGGQPLC